MRGTRERGKKEKKEFRRVLQRLSARERVFVAIVFAKEEESLRSSYRPSHCHSSSGASRAPVKRGEEKKEKGGDGLFPIYHIRLTEPSCREQMTMSSGCAHVAAGRKRKKEQARPPPFASPAQPGARREGALSLYLSGCCHEGARGRKKKKGGKKKGRKCSAPAFPRRRETKNTSLCVCASDRRRREKQGEKGRGTGLFPLPGDLSNEQRKMGREKKATNNPSRVAKKKKR